MEQSGHDEWSARRQGGILLNRLLQAGNRTVLVAITAQTMQFGAALALIPFMVTRLSPAEIGIWYVFVGLQTLAVICDFGFLPSFTRAFALAHAGAEQLATRGVGERLANMDALPNYQLLAEVKHAAKLFYRVLGLGILAAAIGIGLPYVTHLAHEGALDVQHIQVAWLIFTGAVGLNLALQWVGPALLGTGRVEQNYLVIIANRGGFSILGIAVLLMGGGLVALSGAMLIAQIPARLLAAVFLRNFAGERTRAKLDRNTTHAILRTLWPNAARMGIVSIGGFLITRYGLFAVSTFVGLAGGGSYAISLQMLSAVSAVSQLPMQVFMPRLVTARVARDMPRLRRMYTTAMLSYLCLSIVGSSIVLIAVPRGLELIGSHTSLLPSTALALMAIVMTLEGFHSNAAFFITTGNDVPFVRASLISGVVIVAGTTFAGWLGLGIAAMIGCQGIVQLLYNNWRWPWLAWKEVTGS